MHRDTRLIIFDCDGVLVDSERLANEALAAFVTESGLPTTLEQAMATYKGLSMTSVIGLIEDQLGRRLPDDWLATLNAHTNEVFRAQLRAVEGVETAIIALKDAGFGVCVASSGSHDKMDLTLGLTGLKGHFENVIFSASEVARGKPHPDLFLHAAAAMNRRPPECVVVEDSVPGVQAGVAAGMRVCGFAGDPLNNAGALARAGAEVFTQMAELPRLVREP